METDSSQLLAKKSGIGAISAEFETTAPLPFDGRNGALTGGDAGLTGVWRNSEILAQFRKNTK